MQTELKEKDLLATMIKSLKTAKIKKKDLMDGLIETLDEMKKNHFPADFKWATKMVFLISGGWPDIMNKNNRAFTAFCKSLPKAEPVLKDWEHKLFYGDKEIPENKNRQRIR